MVHNQKCRTKEQKNGRKAHEKVWPLDEVRREHTSTKSVKGGIDKSKRPRGRPRLTWVEQMRKQLQAINLTRDEARHQAKDCKKWRIWELNPKFIKEDLCRKTQFLWVKKLP